MSSTTGTRSSCASRSRGATGPLTLLSTSQGCADAGLCYPPQVAKATLTLAGAASRRAIARRGGVVAPAAAALDDPSRIERTLNARQRSGWIALLFVGLGVLLAFTPCVLPMVPILSSILVGGGHRRRAGRAPGFVLAVVYSLGMALVYTLLGVAAGLAGEGLAATLQAPWILGDVRALLVALSLSMFGFYELQVPAALQARLAGWSGRVGGSAGSSAARARRRVRDGRGVGADRRPVRRRAARRRARLHQPDARRRRRRRSRCSASRSA